jgi:prepilin-type N-terminal cleavage/methylation domain-containing protein
MKSAVKTKFSSAGFSLLEVMIAITLFAFFITAFLASQGYNVADSALSEEQLMLQSLAERKINELHLDPPKFSNATDNLKETKTFEEKDLSGYEYTLEIKKLTMPDFGQLLSQGANSDQEGSGNEGNEGNDYMEGNNNQKNAALEKMVFDELKKNIEKIIWQARVTITNKETKYSYSLSTFLTNYNEKIQLNIGF